MRKIVITFFKVLPLVLILGFFILFYYGYFHMSYLYNMPTESVIIRDKIIRILFGVGLGIMFGVFIYYYTTRILFEKYFSSTSKVNRKLLIIALLTIFLIANISISIIGWNSIELLFPS